MWRYYRHIFADLIILWLLQSGITILIHNKDDIEFVTEFPCLLGHPVESLDKEREVTRKQDDL